MKKILISFIMIFTLISCENHKTDIFPNEEVVEEDSLFQDYMNIAYRLGDLITIDAATFAAASITVHYSESAYQNVTGDADSNGIFQATKATRKALNISSMENMPVREQLVQYEVFLRACSKKALQSIKNSEDLHALHFAPSRMFSKILSKASNRNLKALDKNKDGVITRDDLKLFQQQRVKDSQQVKIIYDQFFNNKV